MQNRRRTGGNLFMTHAAPDESRESSRAPSPVNTREPLIRSVSSLSTEQTPLLRGNRSRVRIQSSTDLPGRLSRKHSNQGSLRHSRNHSRAGSLGQRLITAFTSERSRQSSFRDGHLLRDERVWYDQFTSTDWVHDSIADAHRLKALRNRKDIRGKLESFFDGAQGWILSALVGFLTACLAYTVDIAEAPVFDWKDGYCTKGFLLSEKRCCEYGERCNEWVPWSTALSIPGLSSTFVEWGVYVTLGVLFSTVSCFITLRSKTVVPSRYQLSTLDENLGAVARHAVIQEDGTTSPKSIPALETSAPMVYYSAAGSGVAEVRVILSGFVLHGFLGVRTLVLKTMGLILSVASGLSLGKEGPFVHIATCIGNIACRLFSKYDNNDGKRREVLSAAAAAGVAVAFGAPLGGVLFSLEEVAYFFPAKTLFRTFFCCITAALTLKFLNPYGTNKIVIFEVRYLTDWEFFELGAFIAVGVLGGACGAIFIKASKNWAQSFRKIGIIKRWPVVEVMLVAVLTGLVSFWNPFTKVPVAKLLFNLASPCEVNKYDTLGLCPGTKEEILPVVGSLALAFLIKGTLTIITFGIKVPAGIYVPSMVVGGLGGRLIGHLIQWIVLRFPNASVFGDCAAHASGTSCVTPGVYALIAAGSTMCGVTRLSVTLAVILFELTGSLDYVLPFSLAILVAKWTADFIEPLSIYDLLTNLNSYPFLNNKHKPIFTGDLGDIVPRIRRERIIDVSTSPLVKATSLRMQLKLLQDAGELDGGLPVIRDEALVGLIPAPELEYALDQLENEEGSLCLMTKVLTFHDSDDEEDETDPTDFTPYVDPAPIALDRNSSMDLVYECFVKLGLRYVCVTRDGRYAGLIHKKTFVKYIRELEEKEELHHL